LTRANTSVRSTEDWVTSIVSRAQNVLFDSGYPVSRVAQLEISHHYGVDRFFESGACMITEINRDYCKKVIILFAGQCLPEHFHRVKEESFVLLYGDAKVLIDGKPQELVPGHAVPIFPGKKHSISTKNGCVIEEISTKHYTDDSFYSDQLIMSNLNRKTLVSFWNE